MSLDIGRREDGQSGVGTARDHSKGRGRAVVERLRLATEGRSGVEIGALTLTHPDLVERCLGSEGAPPLAFVLAVADRFGYRAQWLLTGEGEARRRSR